jgi:translation initiation factor IF-2
MRDYGAAIADLALLLVSADEGVREQTLESIGVLEALMGGERGGEAPPPCIVCLSKVDLLPFGSEGEGRVRQLAEELREFVALTACKVVPISATGTSTPPSPSHTIDP